MREGGCIGGATTPQQSMLRLIRNAAAFAVPSPTLLFNPFALYSNALSEHFRTLIEGCEAKTELVRVVLRWHSSGSKVRLGLPVGL